MKQAISAAKPTSNPHPSAQAIEKLPMRIGFGSFAQPTEARLKYCKQLGFDDILLNMYRTPLIDTNYAELPLKGDSEWSYSDLVALRSRVEDAGLRLNAIENLPKSFYDKIMLGKPGRERQIECVQRTIQNIARAGIPYLGYLWDPTDVLRSSTTYRIRGGAETMAIDLKDFQNAPPMADRVYSENEMWEYYHYFLEHVLPVAEQEGLKLAVHPNDPPVPALGGVPRLHRSRENYDKTFALVPSPNHGCEFCLGNWSAMGEDILDVIDHYSAMNKIFYVHFQTISNPLPQPLHEVFVDQKGWYDPVAVLKKLRDVGFRGLIIAGHVPRVIGDGVWCEQSNAYTAGFMRGILRALDQLDPRPGFETLN
ncbi:mannonate dehydratase [Fontivita pretiosa]|uniref:mannonate dehydratase n=1 Tax=Fontivita pretiosa TaxID=2989684 RepID=UPI003D18671E